MFRFYPSVTTTHPIRSGGKKMADDPSAIYDHASYSSVHPFLPVVRFRPSVILKEHDRKNDVYLRAGGTNDS